MIAFGTPSNKVAFDVDRRFTLFLIALFFGADCANTLCRNRHFLPRLHCLPSPLYRHSGIELGLEWSKGHFLRVHPMAEPWNLQRLFILLRD